MSIALTPTILIWFIQGVRAGSLTFFSAVNPALYSGGLFSSSKEAINALIPKKFMPGTIYFCPGESIATCLTNLRTANIGFPIIVKPDQGERGYNVEIHHDLASLEQALKRCAIKVIIQEYIDYSLEYSILCYQNPEDDSMGVSSVCIKEFLQVTGDGTSTIRQLMRDSERAILQIPRLEQVMDLEVVPPKGEQVILERVGNHNRGTKFRNGAHLINDTMVQKYGAILEQMPDIHFGRFDLKARSEADFINADRISILEFNGANSEPVHMYDPEIGFFGAYRILWSHWSLIRRIGVAQMKQGVPTMRVSEAYRGLMNYLEYKRIHKTS